MMTGFCMAPCFHNRKRIAMERKRKSGQSCRSCTSAAMRFRSMPATDCYTSQGRRTYRGTLTLDRADFSPKPCPQGRRPQSAPRRRSAAAASARSAPTGRGDTSWTLGAANPCDLRRPHPRSSVPPLRRRECRRSPGPARRGDRARKPRQAGPQPGMRRRSEPGC